MRVLVSADRLAAGSASTGTESAERLPVGTAHLAAALLAEPEGLAAKAIAAAGLSAEQVYGAIGAGPAQQVTKAESVAPLKADLLTMNLDEDTKVALKDTLRWALRLGHNYVGTEHLLLGLTVHRRPGKRRPHLARPVPAARRAARSPPNSPPPRPAKRRTELRTRMVDR